MTCIVQYTGTGSEIAGIVVPRCLLVNVRNGDGDMEAQSCEELIEKGNCPKKRKVK